MTAAAVAIFTGPGRPLEHHRIELPTPGPGEVLVRISACTLCGSDLHSFHGRRSTPVPIILGHEIIGRVAAFGPDAPRRDAEGATLSLGDRITWSLVAACGQCFYCDRSLPQKCARSVKYGHEPISPSRELTGRDLTCRELTGGLAEYCVLAPGTTIVRLPDSLADASACPANCATATAAAALAAVGPLRDRAVVITGAGMLGLTACAMARSLGAAEVICCEPNSDRLSRSRDFGATRTACPDELQAVVKEITGGYRVDAVIEMSGVAAAFESTLPLLRAGGAVALVGAVFPGPPVALPMETIVRRNLLLIGIHNYAPADLQAAVRFLAGNPQYPFEALLDHWFPLSAADEAFARAGGPRVIRVGIRPA